MTNQEFLTKVENIIAERRISKYRLIKMLDPEVLKYSTVYSMFERNSAAKLEYVFEISKALNIPVADMIEIETEATSMQKKILAEFAGYSDEVINRALPIIRGVLISEGAKEE